MDKPIKIGILLLALFPIILHAAPSQYPCHEIVYYAQTRHHQKELLVCVSDSKLALTYGKIHQSTAEVDILAPTKEGTWFKHTSPSGAYSVGLSVKKPPFQYIIYGFTFNDILRAGMIVTKHNRFVANIRLDPRTAINTIGRHLNAIGLSENKHPIP